MNDKLIYDSNEISNIVSNTKELNDQLESDIKVSIDNDFQLLKEFEFFSDGFLSIKTKIDKIMSLNNDTVSYLVKHDEEMNQINNKHISLFSGDTSSETDTSTYSGEQVVLDDIVLKDITDCKKVLTKFVSEVVPSFSYDEKLKLLKNILSEEGNSLSIFTNIDESDIITWELKDSVNSDYLIELSKLTKEDEKYLQKTFFDSITDNDTNIFDDIEVDSFLNGLSYFKQVAEKNEVSVSDIIFDDDKQEMFMEIVSDIYNSDQIDVLTDDELNSVKNYINDISECNNIPIEELLTDTKYSSVIKGGIYYED